MMLGLCISLMPAITLHKWVRTLGLKGVWGHCPQLGSLSQIYSALVYYWGNQEALDAEIKHRLEQVEALRYAAPPPRIAQKLRGRGVVSLVSSRFKSIICISLRIGKGISCSSPQQVRQNF
jgi:hypothetical protein